MFHRSFAPRRAWRSRARYRRTRRRWGTPCAGGFPRTSYLDRLSRALSSGLNNSGGIAMFEIQKSPFRLILFATTILILFASSSLPADIKAIRKQAEAGDAKAQFNIGSMYENGSGVRQDYAEAAKWYRKAAERGDGEGQYNLGILNQNGWGVPQDDKEAVKWYRKAAVQGV